MKIGGPAVSGYAEDGKWTKDFLKYLTADGKRVPLDFFSWHIYTTSPDKMLEKCVLVRSLLDKYGYTEAESILNEWNYVHDWSDTVTAFRKSKREYEGGKWDSNYGYVDEIPRGK